MRSNVNPKHRWGLVFWLVTLVTAMIACNLPTSGFQAFVAPSGQEGSPTPNWSATLEAAVPQIDWSTLG